MLKQELQLSGHETCQFVQFDSMGEMADEAVKVMPLYPEQVRYALNDPKWIGRDFRGGIANVRKATDEAWGEGLRHYDEMMDELRKEHLPPPKNIRRRSAWSEDGGDEVCLDRLKVGQPYWRTTHRDARPGPLNVTIITDIATSCSVEHQKILWRGAAAVCLTQLLEEAGYRVELWAAGYCRNAFQSGYDSHASAACYKRSSDPLDVSTMISGISGWCYRTLFFSNYNHFGKAPGWGLGTPSPISVVAPHITPDEKALVCSALWNRTAAIAWVKQQLEVFNG